MQSEGSLPGNLKKAKVKGQGTRQTTFNLRLLPPLTCMALRSSGYFAPESKSNKGPRMHLSTKSLSFSLCCAALLCAAEMIQAQTITPGAAYAIRGADILQNDVPTVFGGANAFFIYGGSTSSMAGWNINIVREPLPDFSETPISGSTVQGSDGSYLHPMADVVADNRANGKITILCPFQWAPGTGQFAGLVPSKQTYYAAYKEKMQAVAAYFANQPDVWLETWNEPYPDANDPNWLRDTEDMVDNIRDAGGNNIVLVPGDYFGSSEGVILSHGRQLLEGRANILFDLHGYAWEQNSQESTEQRIRTIRSRGFALIFGEDGPGTSGGVVDPTNFLKAALHQEVSTLLWNWNFNTYDPNAFFTSSSQPNDTAANFNWSTTAKSFLKFLGGSGDDYAVTNGPTTKPYTSN